jgi:hypothetical protein
LEIKNNGELVEFVNERKLESKHLDLDFETEYNLLYYAGKQYLDIDLATGQLVESERTEEDKYDFLVANKIQPIITTALSKITKNKPIVNAIPATMDEDDVASAKVAEQLCKALEFKLELPDRDEEVIMFGLTTPIAFIKCYWNANAGVEIDKGVFEGDVEVCIVPVTDIFWNRGARNWSEVSYVIHNTVRDVKYVEHAYGVEVASDADVQTRNIFSGIASNSAFSGQTIEKDKVIVSEYWEKPSVFFPLGRRITVAGETLLYYSESIAINEQDTQPELPFFPFKCINLPGVVHGQSLITSLIPIQKERNKARSMISKNAELTGSPAWIVEEDSILSDILGVAGEVIEVEKGTDRWPELTQPTQISQEIYRNIEMCDEEMYFISGQSEASRQLNPNMSGVALSILQEQDDTKIGPVIRNYERCKERYMSYLLKLVKFNYTEPRTLKYMGEETGEVEVLAFKGSELTTCDIRIQAGSALPQSKVAQQEFILSLVDRGLIDLNTQKAAVLELLGVELPQGKFIDPPLPDEMTGIEQWQPPTGEEEPMEPMPPEEQEMTIPQ